jgi:carbamoyltransferase
VSYSSQIFSTIEDNKKYRAEMGFIKESYFTRAIGIKFPLIAQLRRVFNITKFLLKNGNAESKTKEYLQHIFPGAELHYIHHHLAHAWATVPFFTDTKRRIVITLDGQGDDSSGSINLFENGDIKVLQRIPNANSIGSLYGSVVEFLGMSRTEHEFKVMGLAPYAKKTSGEKVYQKLKEYIWFDKESMTIVSSIDTRQAVSHLLVNDFLRFRFDSLAYGVQKLTEEIIVEMVKAVTQKYSCNDIAVGGGVFMNVKANQLLANMPEVNSLIICPSCGDESLAIGNAVYGYAQLHGHDLKKLKMIKNLYLGSSYSDVEIKKEIDSYDFCKQCTVSYFDPHKGEKIEKKVAEILANNGVVGRFKGRAEWGARALGNRSILANPSSRDNVKIINEMIKGRDFWMPFATSVKEERVHDYLEMKKDVNAQFMAITFNSKPRAHKELIAALHPYDLTSRPQVVSRDVNEEYHSLISHYETLTQSGGILNTSFNLHGEPNVEKPYDALRTFELSGLQYLAIGNYLISKKS